jgi:hypothetical protein
MYYFVITNKYTSVFIKTTTSHNKVSNIHLDCYVQHQVVFLKKYGNLNTRFVKSFVRSSEYFLNLSINRKIANTAPNDIVKIKILMKRKNFFLLSLLLLNNEKQKKYIHINVLTTYYPLNLHEMIQIAFSSSKHPHKHIAKISSQTDVLLLR